MRSLGLTTLRFSNSEVLTNTDKIAEMIFDYFSKILLSPPLKRGTTVSAKRTVGIEK